jgi:hypothetical protein
MNWGAALVAIVVALIAAGAGFIGGYLGSKWNAETELAQWQRDRLLQYCSDLLAAAGEIVDVGRDIQEGKQPPFPYEASRRMEHAVGGISLLSFQLHNPASDFAKKTLEIMKEPHMQLSAGHHLTPAMDRSAKARGLYMRRSHDLLMNIRPRPSPLHRAWARVKPNIRGIAVSMGLMQAPVVQLPPASANPPQPPLTN